MSEAPIKIQMLGGFRISSGEYCIEELSKRAPKFWNLLQYLIVYRHRSVPQEELIDAIWPDCREGNPGNAIRNMVFRVRSALKDSGVFDGKEMLLHTGGGYAWNNDPDCVVDFEEFEKLYKQASSGNVPARSRLDILLEAIELYKGDFLPNAGCEQWAMPLISYYRSMYFKCVHTALELLMEQGLYPQAEMICKKALLIDRFDEKVHVYHLQSLISQSRQAEALGEYQKIETLFFEGMGISPSDALREIYTEILRPNNGYERPLEDLTLEWIKSADFSGAYYCEYGVFKTIYQVEARSVARSGRSVYVCSIEVCEDLEEKGFDIMRHLNASIRGSLRKGDLFTRSGPRQYLIMLHELTYKDCKMVGKKILRSLDKKYRAYTIKQTVRPIASIR